MYITWPRLELWRPYRLGVGSEGDVTHLVATISPPAPYGTRPTVLPDYTYEIFITIRRLKFKTCISQFTILQKLRWYGDKLIAFNQGYLVLSTGIISKHRKTQHNTFKLSILLCVYHTHMVLFTQTKTDHFMKLNSCQGLVWFLCILSYSLEPGFVRRHPKWIC